MNFFIDKIQRDTVLMDAVNKDDIEKIKLIIQKSPHLVNESCSWGLMPLARAVLDGKHEIAKELIDADARLNDIYQVGHDGNVDHGNVRNNNMMIDNADIKDFRMLKLLVDSGAEITERAYIKAGRKRYKIIEEYEAAMALFDEHDPSMKHKVNMP